MGLGFLESPIENEEALSNHLEGLAQAITDARATLSAIRIVGPRYFLLTALAGYLWNSIAVADTLLIVVKSGVGHGAGPLKRLLHESYLDAMFLVSDPDADLLAARCFLSEYLDSLALVREYRQVIADHPEANLPPVPTRWLFFDNPSLDFIRDLDKESAEHGGSNDLFSQAWDWWQRRPHWHWSGISRKKMVDVLIERGKLDGRTAFIALSLTRMYNAAAHAGPPWGELLLTDDGSVASLPAKSSAMELSQIALSGGQLLAGLSKEVKEFFTLNAA